MTLVALSGAGAAAPPAEHTEKSEGDMTLVALPVAGAAAPLAHVFQDTQNLH